MADKAEVGKFYIITDARRGNLPAAYWSSSADAYLDGKPRKCTGHYLGNSAYGSWASLEGVVSTTTGNKLWFHPELLDEAPMVIIAEPSTAPINVTLPASPCKCDLWRGCSCGAFKREMQSRGLVLDRVRGLWVGEKRDM